MEVFEKSKLTRSVLRPLRAALLHWYEPHVVTPLHAKFARFCLFHHAHRYAYPVVKERGLKVQIHSTGVRLDNDKKNIKIYQYNRGLILLRNGDYDRALQAFAMAVNTLLFEDPKFLFTVPSYVLFSYFCFKLVAMHEGLNDEEQRKFISPEYDLVSWLKKEFEPFAIAFKEKQMARLIAFRADNIRMLKELRLVGLFDRVVENMETKKALNLLTCFNKVSLESFRA